MVVYKATVNSKIYIGISSNLERRKRVHRAMAKYPQTYFHRAIAKYGWEAVIWEVIDRAGTWEELCEKEKFYIKSLGANVSGYNLTGGGDGQFGTSRPAWNKGKTLSAEYRDKLSKSHLGQRNVNWGKFGEQASHFTGWWVTPNGKFPSLREAASAFGVTQKTIQNRCLSKNQRWAEWSRQEKL